MTGKEFNIIITKLRPRLIGFASKFVKGGPSTPEDMVQEAIIKLWKSNELQKERNPEALTIQIL
ncbi:MAG: sigma factor, partial [Bacteroidales bacterium]|nr:sigma factor [Bacteroidales bacterium]